MRLTSHLPLYRGSLLGLVRRWAFQMLNCQQKITRYPKKKIKMAHSREQNKSPESDPKETQALDLTKTLEQFS